MISFARFLRRVRGRRRNKERQEAYRQQTESNARVEALWNGPKFEYANGVKVCKSYEDYCR